MLYPKKLLPLRHYKKLNCIELNAEGLFLVRQAPKDLVESEDFINAICENSNHLFDYSTFLIGDFSFEDIQISLLPSNRKKELISYWSEFKKVYNAT